MGVLLTVKMESNIFTSVSHSLNYFLQQITTVVSLTTRKSDQTTLTSESVPSSILTPVSMLRTTSHGREVDTVSSSSSTNNVGPNNIFPVSILTTSSHRRETETFLSTNTVGVTNKGSIIIKKVLLFINVNHVLEYL
jgi:hypothetical protein